MELFKDSILILRKRDDGEHTKSVQSTFFMKHIAYISHADNVYLFGKMKESDNWFLYNREYSVCEIDNIVNIRQVLPKHLKSV